MDYGYVCWRCRTVSTRLGYGSDQFCPKGHHMQYAANFHLPRSRDDHKMWKLAEEKYSDRSRRRRRRAVRSKLAQWERELLRAAKK